MKKIIALLLVLVMALSMAACGGDVSQEIEKKTIVYWSMWRASDPQGQAIAYAVDQFSRETGIKVDLRFKGRRGIHDELKAALDAGETIDLFDEDMDCVNTTFAPYLLNLESLAEAYRYEDNAFEALVNVCREEGSGHLMSIPYQPSITGFFYNADIFAEAGVSAPANWEEFLDVCAKIKAAGYTPITCDDTFITGMMGHHLGRLAGEDGVRDIVANGRWDDPAVVQFAEQFAELAAKGYFSSNIESNVFPNGRDQELAGGEAAMYLCDSRMPNEVKGIVGESFAWGCFPYPAVDDGSAGTEAANFEAKAFAINVNSAVSEEAFQLICHLTKGEGDQLIADLSFSIPTDVENTRWPDMISCAKPVMEAASVRWSKTVGVESNIELTPAIRENLLKLCGGSISAEQFINNMLAASGK